MVDGHLAVLVARLAERRVRRGPRALWGLVANACAAAAIEEAQAAGHSARRTAELVDAFFGTPGWPLPTPPLLQVAAGGRDRLVRRRVTCCLHYTVADSPCTTCPLLPAEETKRRMSART
jgi:FhuF 2Fe-2S C-terminal domain